MNRAEQMMKRAEDTGAGNHLIRKTISGQYKGENRPAGRITTVLSRRGMVTGLALLLSAGMCGGARGDIISFTYTIVANTCTLTSTGATTDTTIGASSSFDVNWGTLTREQLTPGHEVTKNFGVEMSCAGLPYAPKLTITGTNSTTTTEGTLYVSDSGTSAAGFAVRAATSDGATETDKTTAALKGKGTATSLAEDTKKKILLTAWPTLMPGKKLADLKGVRDIKGAVTITVSYN
ncbi:fimbrial protein [Salmonella enterica]|uniref:fimbrial protein n=1 Tax=Salmonella enterica TaxID=28901 RepID=UPI001CBBF2E3|nr:fimbrial protein [Salmonella enterica]EJC4647871.1 fimbrial protein [Salmonella enterica]EKQ9927469.1 fimbrial protein [Salmonella enterica subsp. enterica serovar Panama]